MDYATYELQRSGLRQMRHGLGLVNAATSLALKLMPPNPFLTEDTATAGMKLFDRLQVSHRQPDFAIDQALVGDRLVPVTEEVVAVAGAESSFAQLLHFRKDLECSGPTVLIIPPMSGHFSTLARGTIRSMLKEHDVFVINWVNSRDIPPEEGRFDLDVYIRLLIEYLKHLGPETHVLAICQAGVPALAAISAMSMENAKSAPKTLALYAAPIDPRRNPTTPCRFATDHPMAWFENHMIKTVAFNRQGHLRRVYPGYLQLTGFMSMNPDRHFGKTLEKLAKLAEGDEVGAEEIGAFYDEYLSVMDLTAEFYLGTIDLVFQRFALPRGCFPYGDITIDPRAVTKTAVFTFEGDRDDITGLGQTRAALELLTGLPASRKAHLEVEKCGHYGIFNGSRFEHVIMPWHKERILVHA